MDRSRTRTAAARAGQKTRGRGRETGESSLTPGQLLAHLRHLGTGIHGYLIDPAQSTHSVLFLSLAQPWEELLVTEQLLSLTADRWFLSPSQITSKLPSRAASAASDLSLCPRKAQGIVVSML